MRILNGIAIISATLLLCTNCGYMSAYGRAGHRARNAFSAGDYDLSVKESVTALVINNEYQEAREILQKAFPVAISRHDDNIRKLKASQDEFKWDAITVEYEKLHELVNLMNQLGEQDKINLLQKTEIEDYTSLINSSLENSAEAHYQAGFLFNRRRTKEDFQKAAIQFKTADQILPGYKDADELYEQNRQKGILVIAVSPFENKSGKPNFGDIGETLVTELIADLMSDERVNEFIQIVRRDKLELVVNEQQLSESGIAGPGSLELGNILEAQQIISGTITQITVSHPNHSKSTKRLKKSVVVDKVSVIGDEGKKHIRKIYGDVRAKAILNEVTAGAKILANYSLIDLETGQILHTENISGDWKFYNSWATFTGDERALDSRTASLCRKKQIPIPSKEEMVALAINNLQGNLSASLKTVLQTEQ